MAAMIPVEGCLVYLKSDGSKNLKRGKVEAVDRTVDGMTATVRTAAGSVRWAITELVCGFAPNHTVDCAIERTPGQPWGAGVVEAVRVLGGVEQVLVQFQDSGEMRWFPFQTLRHVTPVENRLAGRIVGQHENHAERVRLRTLGRALRAWDANTGAFGRLDIDPLPHQLHVAKRVVTSENSNWLIADDVGLGKTIEVGLILHALAQRNRCRRVLIICPAGLATQWRDEMIAKFGRSFAIYGRTFTPELPQEIALQDAVIVSMDLAKRDEHLAMLRQGGPWDVVVVDEAHRLGRSETGERTQRFVMAEQLRTTTPVLLLLTATPHQGKTGRFSSLLELVRPDLRRRIRDIGHDPAIVGEIVIRNRKTRVTDAQGNLIFRGHDTQRVPVQPSDSARRFDTALRRYLQRGYGIAERGGSAGSAIGFVMATYRKLASSSVAAIDHALRRRLDRLENGAGAGMATSVEDLLDTGVGEGDDPVTQLTLLFEPEAFFEDEAAMLREILPTLDAVRADDRKREIFLERIVAPLLDAGENLLVFTEYRATQRYLHEALAERFPNLEEIALVNGSMRHREKTESVKSFNAGNARVLISTEAGAEGLNMHESCHVMVNFDLPWNPSRLVQRIGRLYRYGQSKRVQVINLQIDDGFDNQAISLMLDRVQTIAQDMANVSAENAEALQADILGELLSNIDMEDLLERAESMSIERTKGEIEAAIRDAREAQRSANDILDFADAYESGATSGLGPAHMSAFVRGMLPFADIGLRRELHSGKVLEIELPESLVDRFYEFGRRRVIQLTADHAIARRNEGILPLDFDSDFVKHLARLSEDRRRFDGLYGIADTTDGPSAALVWLVRWQSANGELLEEELLPITLDKGARWQIMEPERFGDLLLTPCPSLAREHVQADPIDPAPASPVLQRVLAQRATERRIPIAAFLLSAREAHLPE